MLQKFLSLRFNNLIHDEFQLIVSNEFNVGFTSHYYVLYRCYKYRYYMSIVYNNEKFIFVNCQFIDNVAC